MASSLRALCCCVVAGVLAAAPARAQSRAAIESEKSAAALTAIQHHWSEAEALGDTAYLNRLLHPDYQSVNVDGSAHAKAAILAGALKHRGSDEGRSAMAQLATWLKAHPHETKIVITDDTAVMSYYLPSLGAERGITSSDILVYRDHHWQALYSAHTAAKL